MVDQSPLLLHRGHPLSDDLILDASISSNLSSSLEGAKHSRPPSPKFLLQECRPCPVSDRPVYLTPEEPSSQEVPPQLLLLNDGSSKAEDVSWYEFSKKEKKLDAIGKTRRGPVLPWHVLKGSISSPRAPKAACLPYPEGG
ncbi:hypothetical protein HAX54_004146 [Datura stramonium]|uniref:Uncharacterized protein n=1 Tax=Datura stramonium TaxID=4076 RepID=A0ABS8WV67_DATST|nr:hypothetical protein [Datura stramonium]